MKNRPAFDTYGYLHFFLPCPCGEQLECSPGPRERPFAEPHCKACDRTPSFRLTRVYDGGQYPAGAVLYPVTDSRDGKRAGYQLLAKLEGFAANTSAQDPEPSWARTTPVEPLK